MQKWGTGCFIKVVVISGGRSESTWRVGDGWEAGLPQLMMYLPGICLYSRSAHNSRAGQSTDARELRDEVLRAHRCVGGC